MHRKLRRDRHCDYARNFWRIASCAATAMATVRAIFEASPFALRPSWRLCAQWLMHRKLRCDRHGDYARNV